MKPKLLISAFLAVGLATMLLVVGYFHFFDVTVHVVRTLPGDASFRSHPVLHETIVWSSPWRFRDLNTADAAAERWYSKHGIEAGTDGYYTLIARH